jgi:hypothetical protein
MPQDGEANWLGPYTSPGQRLGEKMQALVHPVIDTAMVVGELLVAMRNAELVQPAHEPAGTVEQIEQILHAAVDVERLQSAEIVRLDFDRNYGVPPPNRPASRISATCRRHGLRGPALRASPPCVRGVPFLP